MRLVKEVYWALSSAGCRSMVLASASGDNRKRPIVVEGEEEQLSHGERGGRTERRKIPGSV